MTTELRIFTEPQQGASYDTLLAVAKKTEENGFDAFFRSDHFLKMGDVDGLPGPTDAWTTLAGLARETSRIRLGTLVTAATFRHPGVLAVQVAQVDQMSGGRVELGLGTGWYEQEHSAYGIPFPAVSDRFDIYAEQLAVVTGLWDVPAGETFDYAGKHYQISDSPGLPKPAQSPHPPIIIGGLGRKRTPELTAKYADEFNLPFAPLDVTREQFGRVADALEAAGRGRNDIVWSNALIVAAGKDDAEFRRRAAAIGREPEELKTNGLAGSPAEIVDKIGTYSEAGSSRFYLQVMDLSDLDHLDLIASEILPQLS